MRGCLANSLPTVLLSSLKSLCIVSLVVILARRQRRLRDIWKWSCTLARYGIAVRISRSLGVHINTHNIAVLLIDEADVFLEERTMADIQRNSLVSGTYSKLD